MFFKFITFCVICVGLTGCSSRVCKEVLVKEVGGCSKDGYCGVLLEDGTTAKAYYPVKGGKSIVCK